MDKSLVGQHVLGSKMDANLIGSLLDFVQVNMV